MCGEANPQLRRFSQRGNRYMGEKPKVESDPEKGGFSPPMEKPRKDNVGPAPTDDPDAQVPKKTK